MTTPLPRSKIPRLLELLHRAYPDARIALEFRDPFQLLVATILSAQCTDERVNQVTPALFARYADAAAMAAAEPAKVEELIRSTGFFRNKAKALIAMSQGLVQHHGGEVPRSMEDLVALRGVARKTANVVLGTAYGIASGVVVDTHVLRVSGRLGLSSHSDPVKVEQDLMRLLPQTEWIAAGHMLIHHGRRICQARKPKCSQCPLNRLCPSAFQFDDAR